MGAAPAFSDRDRFVGPGHGFSRRRSRIRSQKIARGERFAEVGTTEENGGWVPHLHFQIATGLLDLGTDFPGVAPASDLRRLRAAKDSLKLERPKKMADGCRTCIFRSRQICWTWVRLFPASLAHPISEDCARRKIR